MRSWLLLLLAGPLAGQPVFIDRGASVDSGLTRNRFAMCCGSMLPHIRGGEFFYYEPYLEGKTAIKRGDWLLFIRQPDQMRVVHELTAMNPRAVYTSGINCRRSDGWSPRRNVIGVVRVVERRPVEAAQQAR